MNTVRFRSTCLVLIHAIGILPGCISAQQAPLAVLSVTPGGPTTSLADCRTIVVTFNQPMVPLQKLPESFSDGPLLIYPALSGTYRWLGTSTLAFATADTLPYATRFQGRISHEIESVGGERLAQDYVWSFETPRPEVVHYYPEDNAKGMVLDTEVALYFNIPMSLDRARPFIGFKNARSMRDVGYALRHPTAEEIRRDRQLGGDTTRVILLKPTVMLNRKTTYQVELRAGLLAAQGDLGTTHPVVFTFETYGDLSFIKIERPQQHDPQMPLEFSFSNPVSAADLVKTISFVPDVAIPDYYFDRTYEQLTVELALPLLPDTTYGITIAPALTDVYGNRLQREVKMTITTGPYAPHLIMTTGAGVLEAYGDRRYPMQYVNVKNVRLQMARIAADGLIPLLSDPSLFFSNQSQPDSLFQVDRVLKLGGRRNNREIHPIEIDWILAGARHGLVLIQVDDMLQKEWGQIYASLLQVTEMGVSAKFSPDNNIIWVTYLKDAAPVPGAAIEIRGDDNKILFRTETDAQGLARTPGWKRLGIRPSSEWERPRQWVFVYKDRDFSYTASDWGTGIYPYRFGINYDWRAEPETFNSIVFSERNLYRAGDTVRVKGLFRQKQYDSWDIPSPRSMQARVYDSHDEKIYDRAHTLSDFGSLDFSVPISEDAALGYYRVTVDTLLDKEEMGYYQSLAQGSFRVEAFRPSEFEVSVRMDRDGYMVGDTLRSDIAAKYLFGGGMAGQKVDWSVRVTSSGFQPAGYDGYFFDPWLYYEGESRFTSQLVSSSSAVLDKDGALRVDASLANLEIYGAAEVTITADVEGPSRQHIAGSASAPLHPGGYYIGIQPQSTMCGEQEELQYKIITVDPQGSPVGDRGIVVKIIKRQYHSVRKAGIGGRYEWISTHVDTVVDSRAIRTGSTAVALSVTPVESGRYFIIAEAQDKRDGRIQSAAYFYVSGEEYVAWEREDDDRIELIADRGKYTPGEVARILVKSPFESAEALVTLEREGILKHYTLTLAGSAPALEVPIEIDYLPNVFVSVVLLKGRVADHLYSAEGEDIGRPAFKIGYVNLPVDPGTKHLTIDVATDRDSYQPGEDVTVTVQMSAAHGKVEKGELTVAVVDAGILNLTGYELPDPFEVFYGERPLSVQTSETRLHVVEQRNYGEKGEDRGGGGAGSSAFAGIDMRTRFFATAYYNPSVHSDDRGSAVIRFTLPDNLTRFKVMVVGHTASSCFGRGNAEFVVKKPLLLQAALPRFARVGDTFEAGVVVQNFTGRDGEVLVQVEAKGIKLNSRSDRTVAVSAGHAQEVRFPFEVQRTGTATFLFTARMGEITDGLQVAIPLREPRSKEVVATYNRTGQSREESIVIPAEVHGGLGGLEVWAASTALSDLAGSVDYLFTYPYGCLEQRVSSILPMIIAGDLVRAFDLPALKGGDFGEVVRATLGEFTRYQLDGGGFSFWPGGNHDSPYVSAYALYALLQAEKHGYQFDRHLLDAGLAYLQDNLRQPYESGRYPFDERVWWCSKAFAVYVLALAGQHEKGYIDKLYEIRASLPLSGKALLLKTLHLTGRALEEEVGTELLNMIRVAPTTAHFEEGDGGGLAWIFYSDVQATAVVLQSLLETRGGFAHDEKVVRWLLERRKSGRWRTTQENIYTLHALATYFELYEKDEPSFTAEIRLAGKQLLKQAFAGYSLATYRTERPLDDFKREKKLALEVNVQGTGQLHYGVRMSYYPLQPLETRDEGIALLKTIAPFNDSLWTGPDFQAGDLIKIELRIITPQGRHYLVVDDPLPAGFEAVDLSLATTSEETAQAFRQDTRASFVWWGGFNHVEKHDERVLLFADYLTAGVHSYAYLARATMAGKFTMPATQAEGMYEPEVFGRLGGRMVIVR